VTLTLFHTLIKHLASTRLASWLLSHSLHRLDRFFLRLSHNRFTLTSWLTGVPVVVLTTTGAKSGRPRTVPLLGIHDGDRVILVASNWGRPQHPAWYYNLKANPQARLSFNGHAAAYRAREASPQEREKFWAQAVTLYVGWQAYRQRAKNRKIPILILSPQTE
jgi:deazaflavin-dependent oxidoreductase (nitroreductase family)